MAKWIIRRDNHHLTIEATSDGRITMDVVPPGEPFPTDADGAQDIRLKLGAAVNVALGGRR